MGRKMSKTNIAVFPEAIKNVPDEIPPEVVVKML